MQRLCFIRIKENVAENNFIYFSVFGAGTVVPVVCSTAGGIDLLPLVIVHIYCELADRNFLSGKVEYNALIGELVDDPAAFFDLIYSIRTVNIDRLSVRDLCRIDRFDICLQLRSHERL